MIARLLISTALLAATFGCASVSVGYARIRIHEPSEQGRIERLEQRLAAGGVALQTCLDELGAPLLVWEAPRGLALAYGRRDEGSWHVKVSHSLRFATPPVQLDLSNTAADLDGVVLWFDDDLELTEIKRGKLRSLAREGTRRPAIVE